MKDFKTLNIETWKEEFSEDVCDYKKLQIYLKSIKEKPETDRAVGEKDPREKHFIMPQYLDEFHKYKDEFVNLEAVEHLRVHVKLFKSFKDEDLKQKLLHSIVLLFKGDAYKRLSPKEIEEIQELISKNEIKKEEVSHKDRDDSPFKSFKDRFLRNRVSRTEESNK